jgi:hypothetical protein
LVEPPAPVMPAVLSKFDSDATKARDAFVTAIWTDTLPRAMEEELRTRTTTTGTYFSDLLGLDNQYYTALSVLAASGFNRKPDATVF